MPKQKTHSGWKKRIKITATGKIMRSHAYIGHLKANKTTKQNRHLGKSTTLDATDYKRVKSLIATIK